MIRSNQQNSAMAVGPDYQDTLRRCAHRLNSRVLSVGHCWFVPFILDFFATIALLGVYHELFSCGLRLFIYFFLSPNFMRPSGAEQRACPNHFYPQAQDLRSGISYLCNGGRRGSLRFSLDPYNRGTQKILKAADTAFLALRRAWLNVHCSLRSPTQLRCC